MSWLSDSLTGLQNTVKATQRDINQSGALGDFFTNTGGSITDAYKAAPGSDELKRTFFDPQRDSAYNSLMRQAVGGSMLLEGKNPFLQQAGDVEYNQNMAKRAAIVAAAIGGAAALGAGAAGGGAGAATTGGATTTAAAPTATSAAAPAAFTPITSAGPVAASSGGGTMATSSAAPGSFAGMYETLGATGGAGAAGGIGAGSTPGTYGAMASGAAVPGGHIASNVAPTAAAGSSSWAPYAQAGGSILSTLFQGLLQMEKERENRVQEIKMTQARAAVERANAQNSALDRLMRVWGR